MREARGRTYLPKMWNPGCKEPGSALSQSQQTNRIRERKKTDYEGKFFFFSSGERPLHSLRTACRGFPWRTRRTRSRLRRTPSPRLFQLPQSLRHRYCPSGRKKPPRCLLGSSAGSLGRPDHSRFSNGDPMDCPALDLLQ